MKRGACRIESDAVARYTGMPIPPTSSATTLAQNQAECPRKQPGARELLVSHVPIATAVNGGAGPIVAGEPIALERGPLSCDEERL